MSHFYICFITSGDWVFRSKNSFPVLPAESFAIKPRPPSPRQAEVLENIELKRKIRTSTSTDGMCEIQTT